MEIKNYRYGGLVFRIISRLPLMTKAQSEQFAVDPALPADFTYEILPLEPDMPHEWDQPTILRRDGSRIRAHMNEDLLEGISAGYFLSHASASLLLPETGRFILHAAFIVHEGQAILFTAPSETGKSTQAHFWQEKYGVQIVNEDRVIIAEENGVYHAHGCWATGTAGVSHNVSAPIRAIVLLGQGRENKVSTPSAVEKLQRLTPQCTFDDTNIGGRVAIIDLLSQLISNVPIVAYDCINHISAVEDLEPWI